MRLLLHIYFKPGFLCLIHFLFNFLTNFFAFFFCLFRYLLLSSINLSVTHACFFCLASLDKQFWRFSLKLSLLFVYWSFALSLMLLFVIWLVLYLLFCNIFLFHSLLRCHYDPLVGRICFGCFYGVLHRLIIIIYFFGLPSFPSFFIILVVI